MKNLQKGSIVPILLAVIAVLIIGVGVYYYHTKNVNSVPIPVVQTTNSDQNNVGATPAQTSVQSVATSSNPGLNTYNNLGIIFKYPTEWGAPKESFSGNGSGSISFAQSFAVFIQQDTNPQGTGVLNETLDQMIARFRTNDQYIYQVKDISADGVQGRELFYNSAVTGQPYHVDAYFPFQNDSYISLGADYQSVSLAAFDSIISTLQWDNATAFKLDSATGMAIYDNNGIRFEYPVKFDTDYASLNVRTSVEKADNTKLDSNGCYPAINGNGKPTQTNVINVNNVNGIKFCSTSSSDVGAGQLVTDYIYMTVRNGNAYAIDYSVHTSNGCGGYQNSSDLNSPDNQKYNECLNAQKNFGATVVKPIQDSISTFTFTN